MEKQEREIKKYLDVIDYLDMPVQSKSETRIIPIDKPYAFIQPGNIDLGELNTADESMDISIKNAGGEILIISRVFADADWILIEDRTPKKALEWSDEPLIIKAKIDRERLSVGKNSGKITIETKLETIDTHYIPVSVRVLEEDAATIMLSSEMVDFGVIPLNKEVRFVIRDSSAKIVYLQGEMTNWELNHILMKKDGEEFHLIVTGIEDGEYLYQFNVDGTNLLDPNNQQQTILNERGPCSILVLNRYSRSIDITNISSETVTVELIKIDDGIELNESKFQLRKGEKRQITINIQPHLIDKETRFYQVDLLVNSQLSRSIKAKASGIVLGPIAELGSQRLSLGEVYFGTSIEGFFSVKNIGNGTLRCSITVDKSWLKPQIFEIPEGAERQIPMPVDSQNLSSGEHKANVILQTNSYTYGTDKYNLLMEFNLISLDIQPQEIDFGDLWVRDEKELSVSIRRSDSAKIDMNVDPDNLVKWLDITTKDERSLKIKLDWSKFQLKSDKTINTDVKIADRNSTLSGLMHIQGRVLIPHITVDELDFGIMKRKKKTLKMLVKNTGEGKLILDKIEAKDNWISIKRKKISRKNKLLQEFLVTVYRREISRVSNEQIKGTIQIFSNDPIKPVYQVTVNVI